MNERKEAFIRIIVGLVSGIIIGLWKTLVQVITIIHWVYVIFSGKRHQGFAEFCNLWNTKLYRFIRYMTMTTNERPFPFTELGEVMDETVFGSKKEIKTKNKKK